MSDNIIDVATNLIKTGGRFRKDFGDIPALAESIKLSAFNAREQCAKWVKFVFHSCFKSKSRKASTTVRAGKRSSR